MSRRSRIAGSSWVRAVVSLGLLAIVLTQIDLAQAETRLSTGRWELFAAAVAVLLVSFLLAAVRWHLFLQAVGVQRRRHETIAAYLLGAFANNFLPSQVGGDVARAWAVGGRGTRVAVAATVVVDRATALACLVAAAWLVYALHPALVPGPLLVALAAATAGLVAAAALAALAVGGAGRLHRRLSAAGREAVAAGRACLRRRVLGPALVLGFLFQGLVLFAVWLLARSVSLDTPFSVLAVTVPAVLILSTLPVSIGGFGVRESSFVLLLGRAGVSTTDATVLSLLSAAAFALASLPGALALLRSRGSARAPQAEDREQEGGDEDLHA